MNMKITDDRATIECGAPSGAVALLEDVYPNVRNELIAYVTRMVIRPEIAEELVQEAVTKWVAAQNLPTDVDGARAWLFRVSTNLAIDYRRRHSTWRENMLQDAREVAVRDEAFVWETGRMAGSPEMKAIAKEHLAVCFACTLQIFPAQQSAALLLTEVNGFSLKEAAEILGLEAGQVKNALQSARGALREKYGATCQLVMKQGVCHQCVELAEHLNGREEDPLDGTPGDIDARLHILRQQKDSPLGPWHRMMMRLIDDLLYD